MPSGSRRNQYSILLGEAIHAAKLAHASSRAVAWPAEMRSACVLAELLVEKCVVEAGPRRVGGAAAVIDRIEPRPVSRRQAHGARLATGVELAPGQRERAQRLACGANGIDLAMRRRIVGRRDGVRALGNDLRRRARSTRQTGPLGRTSRSRWPARWRGAETPDLAGGHAGQLAFSLPERRK